MFASRTMNGDVGQIIGENREKDKLVSVLLKASLPI
jgi:hypothetical protein